HRHLAGDVPAADLFVEGIQQLLPGGRPGEGSSLVKGAPKAALVAKALGGAIEGNPQPVHQVDDSRGPVGHFLYGGLMLQKVAAVNGVEQVLRLAVSLLPRSVVDAVDSPLRANAVRPFDR